MSSAIGGGVTGKLLGKGAPLAKKIVVSALVSGTTDGGLQLGRNVLESRCDIFEDVGKQTIAGALGGAGGEVAEVGLKQAWKYGKGLFKNGDEVVEGVTKSDANKTDAADVIGDRVVCFVAGTPIATPLGFVPIEEIAVGDKVHGGTKEYPNGIFRVRQLFQRQVSEVLDVVVDGVTITCTPEHPFWVEGYEWVVAENLEPGYWLLTKDGVNLPIDSVTRRECETTVYNFEMDEYHTYYVSQLAILCHNTCENAPPPKFSKDIQKDDLNRLEQLRKHISKAVGEGNIPGLSKSFRNKFKITNKKIFEGKNPPRGNIVFADVDIDGNSYSINGFSGGEDLLGFAPVIPLLSLSEFK